MGRRGVCASVTLIGWHPIPPFFSNYTFFMSQHSIVIHIIHHHTSQEDALLDHGLCCRSNPTAKCVVNCLISLLSYRLMTLPLGRFQYMCLQLCSDLRVWIVTGLSFKQKCSCLLESMLPQCRVTTACFNAEHINPTSVAFAPVQTHNATFTCIWSRSHCLYRQLRCRWRRREQLQHPSRDTWWAIWSKINYFFLY